MSSYFYHIIVDILYVLHKDILAMVVIVYYCNGRLIREQYLNVVPHDTPILGT